MGEYQQWQKKSVGEEHQQRQETTAGTSRPNVAGEQAGRTGKYEADQFESIIYEPLFPMLIFSLGIVELYPIFHQ
ncbi:MAG: hypothetical protein M3040_05550 [Bacteroidota bacterium]|nr:hypothetical protein [Bacteroidota bacterium]